MAFRKTPSVDPYDFLPGLAGIQAAGFNFSEREDEVTKPPAGTANVSFSEYLVLPSVSPKVWRFDWRHSRYLQEVLQKFTAGEIKRLMISMPPRHNKSETVTVRYSGYRIDRDPSTRVIIGAYNHTLATKFGRKVKRIAERRIPLAKDRTAADDWETPEGGGCRSVGVGGGVTGMGAHLIVIDDPVKNRAEAESEVYRENVYDWYKDDIYTRLEPGGQIILIMTRWHEDDLAGRILASDQASEWTVVNLPAIAEEEDALERKVGEALCPERYDEAALADIERTIGQYSFNALYQGRPSAREGSFFKVSKLQIVDRIPPGLPNCLSFDNAASEDAAADWTAGPWMHGPDADGIFYVEPWRVQAEPSERNRLMRQRADLLKPQKLTVPKDPSAGKEVAEIQIRFFAEFSVEAVPRRKGETKQLVADPFACQLNAGNVRVVRGPNDSYQVKNHTRSYAADYIEELRNFPNGKNDDQVDGSADAFNKLTAPKDTGLALSPALRIASIKRS